MDIVVHDYTYAFREAKCRHCGVGVDQLHHCARERMLARGKGGI